MFSGSAKASGSSSRTESNTKQFSDALIAELDALGLANADVFNDLINGSSEENALSTNLLESVVADGSIDVDAIMNNFQLESDRQLGQSYQGLARSVGATDNSLVQATMNEMTNDAQAEIASTRAELEAQNTETQTGAAQQLTNLLNSEDEKTLNALNSLFGILKGAETRTKSKTDTSSWEAEAGYDMSAGG